MSAKCCETTFPPAPGYGRVLWFALVVNALMFVVEVVAGLFAASRALVVRSRVATLKGITMGLFGLWVLARAVLGVTGGDVPHAEVMGLTGVVALVANLGVAVLLYRYRNGDSNMRSVWLCTRNDVLGNLAVLLAASGVLALGTRWPDLLVAAVSSSLSLVGAAQILGHARREQGCSSPNC